MHINNINIQKLSWMILISHAWKTFHLPCSLFLNSHLCPSSTVMSLSVPNAALTSPLTNEEARFWRAESRLLGPMLLPTSERNTYKWRYFLFFHIWWFSQTYGTMKITEICSNNNNLKSFNMDKDIISGHFALDLVQLG